LENKEKARLVGLPPSMICANLRNKIKLDGYFLIFLKFHTKEMKKKCKKCSSFDFIAKQDQGNLTDLSHVATSL
jgi:hypothetical protein